MPFSFHAALLVLAPLLAQDPGRAAPGDPRPAPEVQARLERLAQSDDPAERGALLEALRSDAGPGASRLVPQLLLFTEAARSTRAAAVFGLVRAELALRDDEVVRALVPLLASESAARRAALAGILAEFEDRSAERGADFSIYRPFLAGEPPVGLVRHLFETDPDAALLVLTRTQLPAAERRAGLWAWHALADLRWKLAHGYLAPEELAARASEGLDALAGLARGERFWARLAAARLALEHPETAPWAALEALAEDGHALVRSTARAALEARARAR